MALPALCDALRQSHHAARRGKASDLRHPHAHRPQDRPHVQHADQRLPTGDDYFFFLTYGSDVQWVKNVLAAGSCSLEIRGPVVELIEPELVTDPELRPAPSAVRFVERRIAGVTQYLRMRAAEP